MNSSVLDPADGVIDAVSKFLNEPPEGTPQELIQAFVDVAGSGVLPPRVFLKAVEQSPVAISITDTQANILYVNEIFEKVSGYSRHELIGKNQSILSSKSTPEHIYSDLWESIGNGKVWRGSLVNHRKDGDEYVADIMISPVQFEGVTRYYLGMHQDVTQVHQLGQRLSFQRALTEAVLDVAPVVVALLDNEQQVLLDNQAYKSLQGDLKGAEPAALFLEGVDQLDGGFSDREIRIDLPGGQGTRWFSCSAVQVSALNEAVQNYFSDQQASADSLLLVANETTRSRRKAEEAKLNAVRASVAEQKVKASMHEALSGAMFQLQAPLNVIKAALSMPTGHLSEKSLRILFKQVRESGEQALESMRKALPGMNEELVSTINLNEILQDVLGIHTEKMLAAGVTMEWRPAMVLPALHGYSNALRTLFSYLLDNSIVAVKSSRGDMREIRITTRLADDWIEVEICDSGPGIDPSQYLKVFEPFHSGWQQREGHAGMGLPLAREVASRHGGSIEFREPDGNGRGCCALVALPVKGDIGGAF